MPNVVHLSLHPHNIRSAKSAGSEGMASGSESRITGSKQPKQARQEAEDDHRKEQP